MRQAFSRKRRVPAMAYFGSFLIAILACGCSHTSGDAGNAPGSGSGAPPAPAASLPPQAQQAQSAMMQGRAADNARNQAAMKAAGVTGAK